MLKSQGRTASCNSAELLEKVLRWGEGPSDKPPSERLPCTGGSPEGRALGRPQVQREAQPRRLVFSEEQIQAFSLATQIISDTTSSWLS